MKRIGKWWWIGGGLVLVLALYIGISAATGFQTKGEDATVDPRSAAEVTKAAGEHCDDAVQAWWSNRRGSIGLPSNVSAGWYTETADPAGSTLGSSWRLSATYRLRTDRDGGSRTQVFYCDLEWTGSEYRAALV